ncbi:hypothetical protein [Streptomyces sp. NPDC020681]|uniref:hypothetical protein n=1 Tax=Streptomyces sp. NPDC020681 TaxID=3365083 RepID=UPI0037ADA54E
MLGGLVSASTKALGGSRFSLLNILPATVVVTTVAVLVRAGAYSPDGQVRFDHVLPEGKRDALAIALFGLAALLCGILLRPFETALVQLLEGYWANPSPLAPLVPAAVERHRRRRDDAKTVAESGHSVPPPRTDATLQELARHDRRASRAVRRKLRAESVRDAYPNDDRLADEPVEAETHPTDVMPTLLGNVLRRGERVAGDRYGLDMMVVYPRLYPYISDRLEGAVGRQFELITSTASLSISFGLLSLATTPLLARLDPWSAAPFLAAALSVLAYRGAVAASRGHARLLATVFDLHRFDLAAAMHYELPKTPREEYQLNKDITDFLGPGSVAPLRDHETLHDKQFKHPVSGPDTSQRTDRHRTADS